METYNKTMTHTSIIPTHPEQRSWGSTLGHILPWIPRFMILAHLSPGSLQVAEGEIVKEGQGIGQCGNSGNTSKPHIHIHHQHQDPYLYSLVLAED
jgi:Peptidase family M23